MLVAHAKTRIDAPLQQVYEFLMDIERFPTYDEKARKLEYLDREQDLVRISGWYGPIPYSAYFKVTRWPGKGYQSELVAGPLEYARGQFLVREVDSQTELTHIEEYRFYPPAGWLIDRLFKRYVQATVEREVAAVKRQIEGRLAGVGEANIPP